MNPIRFLLSSLLLGFVATPSLFAQDAGKDLLTGFDPSRVAAGSWTRTSDGLRVTPGNGSRVSLANGLPPSYDVTVEFTRNTGNDSVALILPVGPVSPALELSAWQGAAHGLSKLDGVSSRDSKNPTATRPGTLANGRRHELQAQVRVDGSSAQVAAQLDGKSLFAWQGDVSCLEKNFLLNLPDPGALGLAAHNGNVVFHRVQLVTKVGTLVARGKAVAAAKGTIDLAPLGAFATPGWEPFGGAKFVVATEGGRQVLRSIPTAGEKDRGAYLSGVEFSEGTITVDLKGANVPGGSFLGVVFHGVDGATYDAVYFRQFNFGHADPVRRSHAVQYISHPAWPWDRLRAERNGQFEKAMNPEPGVEDWFTARIELEGKRVRVFVNDAKSPSLDIEKMSDLSSGKVGLWFNGIASFANLRIEPKK